MTGLPFQSMNEGRSSGRSLAATGDVELVNACVAGDQTAFAQIYDRYSDRVFSFCLTLTRDRGLAEDAMADTFVTAWQRMSQLRDPSQLRSWLFAIAKNRVSRLGVKASRQVAVDPMGAEMRSAFDVDEATPDIEVSDAIGGDAAVSLVWEAARGLNENERAVLELSVRQGIEGEELASALGVSRHNANVIASRMRQNLERSIGALYLIRYNDDGCVEFSNLVSDYSGALTPLWRKRISRHADACMICSKRKAPKAMAIFGESPVSAAPISARSEILGSLPVTPNGLPLLETSSFRAARNGFPRGGGVVRRLLVGIGVAAVAVIVLTVTTVQMTGNDGGVARSNVAIARNVDADLSVETTTTVVNTETSTSSTTIPRSTTDGVEVVPASPGGATGGGSSPTATVSPTVPVDTAAPKITSVTLSSQSLVSQRLQCSSIGARTAVVTVTAVDNIGIVSGQATIEVSGVSTPLIFSGSGSTVKATIGPFTQTGSFIITRLSVADTAGNRSAVWSTQIAGGITC